MFSPKMDLEELIAFKHQLENDYSSVKQVNEQLKSIVSYRFSSESKNIREPDTVIDKHSLILNYFHLEEQLSDSSTTGYEIFLPRKASPNTKCCLGCGLQFTTAYNVKLLLRFYTHCTLECDQYKRLNLIRKCDNCRLLFINKYSFSNKHRSSIDVCYLRNRHQDKPDWAPKSIRAWNQMHCRSSVL